MTPLKKLCYRWWRSTDWARIIQQFLIYPLHVICKALDLWLRKEDPRSLAHFAHTSTRCPCSEELERSLKELVFWVPENVIGFVSNKRSHKSPVFPVCAVYKKVGLRLRKDTQEFLPITANQLWGVLNVNSWSGRVKGTFPVMKDVQFLGEQWPSYHPLWPLQLCTI